MPLKRRGFLAGLGTAASGALAVGSQGTDVLPKGINNGDNDDSSFGESSQRETVPSEELDDAAAGSRLLLTIDPATVTVSPGTQLEFIFTVKNTSGQPYGGNHPQTFSVGFPDGLLNGWTTDDQFNSGAAQWQSDAVLGNPGWEWRTTYLEGGSLDEAEIVQTKLVFWVPEDASPGTYTWPVYLDYDNGDQTERIRVTVRNERDSAADTGNDQDTAPSEDDTAETADDPCECPSTTSST